MVNRMLITNLVERRIYFGRDTKYLFVEKEQSMLYLRKQLIHVYVNTKYTLN